MLRVLAEPVAVERVLELRVLRTLLALVLLTEGGIAGIGMASRVDGAYEASLSDGIDGHWPGTENGAVNGR